MTRSWRRKGAAASAAEPRETSGVDQEALQREVFRVLNRTSEDQEFRRTLVEMQTEALDAYKLSPEAVTAILAGDLSWLNEHIGDLTQKQLRFVRSCLLPFTAAQS